MKSRATQVLLGMATVVIMSLPSATALAAPKKTEPLVMTYVRSNADYWDLDVAVEKGFFADEGFAPKYVANHGSVQSTQLLLTQDVQLAVTQPESLIAAITRGAKDVGIIAAAMRRVDWMLVGAKGIKSISDLKGKTLGFSGLRVSEFWLTRRLLQEHGIGPKDYSAIQVGITPAKYAALNKGSIAAAVLFQPTASQAVNGGMTRLYLLGRFAGYIPGTYIVNREWAAKNDNGVRLTKALQRAHDWLYDPKNKEEAIKIMMARSKKSEAVINEVYNIFFVQEKWYTKDCGVNTKAVTNAVKTLVDHGIIDAKKAPSLNQILIPAKFGGRRD